MKFWLYLTLALLTLDPLGAAVAPTMTEQLPLWSGPIPNAPENPGPEIAEAAGRVSNVSVPTLDVYLPDPAKATGRAILICSGGGYTRLASGPLGQNAAKVFLPEGIAVFSVKYRTRPPSPDVRRDAAADGKRAVQLIRSRAKEWHIDPNQIDMVGFSAGSNLILNLVTGDTAGDPTSSDPVARESGRPDFIALCATWPFGIKVSQLKIDGSVPPAYLAHAKNDEAAKYPFAEAIAAAWQTAGVPVHLESYEDGGHMAFNFPGKYAADWSAKFLEWLKKPQ